MERFVVGTGRCGSTLLSNMLAMHPQGLVIPECMGAPDRMRAFVPGPVTREELKDFLLSSIPVADLAVRRGSVTKEQLYAEPSNFKVPAYLYITFPTLTDQPAEMFDDMMAHVETLPTQTMADHYRSLYGWLQQRFGRQFWIERTGSSIEYMPDLYRTFPDAKYVHIHRDGPDAALSMSKHFYFHVMVSLFMKPPTRAELEQTELAGKPIHADDPISRRLGVELPTLAQFGEYWSYQIEMGFQAFARMGTGQCLDIRFEDLIARPHQVLQSIADFFDMPDSPGWIDKAAAMVNTGEINSRMDKLSSAEQAALLKACEPGRILLGRYQHPWIYPTLQLIKDVTRDYAERQAKPAGQ